MAAPPRTFWLLWLALLAVPVVLALSWPPAPSPDALHLAASNALWFGAPQVVVALFALGRRFRTQGLLSALAALDVVLLAFWLWVRTEVPPRESALAWVLYPPLAGGVLALIALVAWWRRRRRLRTELGP